MKKLIPILASVAVAGVVALAFMQKKGSEDSPVAKDSTSESAGVPTETKKVGDATPSAPSSSATGESASLTPPTAVAPEAPKVEMVDSLVSKLAAQSLLTFELLPRNVDLLVTPTADFYNRLSQTKAWKRLQPSAAIAAQAEKAAESNPAMAMLGGFGQAGQVPPEVKELWNGLAEFSIALSAKTFPLETQGKKFNIPPLAIIAKFSSDTVAQKYIGLLNQQLEPLKAQAEMMGVQVSQPNPNTLEVLAPVPGAQAPIQASLSMKSPHIVLLLGTNDLLNFFEKKSATPSEAATLNARSWIPTAALAGSVQFDSLFKLIQDLMMASLPEGTTSTQEIQQVKKMIDMYAGLKLVTYSSGVHTGALRANSCINTVSDSSMDKMYKVFADKSTSGGASVAARLIDDQSMLALDYPINMLQYSWTLLQENSKQMGEALPPEQKKGLEAFEKVNGMLNKFGFQKLVLSVATAPAGSMPRGAILLTNSKLSGEDLLKQFADSLNELISYAQTMQGGKAPETPLVKIAKNGTTTQIQIQAGMMPVIGQLAGNNNIAFGIDPYYLSSVSEKLASSTTPEYLISKFAAAKGDLLAASQVTFINSALTLDVLKPWFAMMVPPGKGITAEDLNEISNLLRTSILATQRFDMLQPGLFCSTGATYQN